MIAPLFRRTVLAMLLFAGLAPAVLAQPTPFKTFPTPDDAMTAFVDAVRHDNESALHLMLGSGWRVFVPDAKDDPYRHRERFLAAWDAGHKIVPVSDGKVTVEVGTTGFVMPTPLVKDTAGWRFDVMAGAKEIQARHIGHNEITVVQAMLAIADAEHDYAMLDPMKVGAPTYAARLMSTAGRKDGLYWPVKPGEPKSPLGSLIATAQPSEKGQGFFGYHFRLLDGQGAAAPGGASSYIVNGRMLGGFAAIAWPVRYGETGVMTFLVSYSGQVYEQDLGRDTAGRAATIVKFDPDQGWAKADMTPP
jgi:Protein of unknown function (DUF2950)